MDGGVGHVSRGDVDGSAGKRGDYNGGYGGVVVAVVGRFEDIVLLVAVVGGCGDVFEFRPVGREGGEVGAGCRGEIRT